MLSQRLVKHVTGSGERAHRAAHALQGEVVSRQALDVLRVRITDGEPCAPHEHQLAHQLGPLHCHSQSGGSAHGIADEMHRANAELRNEVRQVPVAPDLTVIVGRGVRLRRAPESDEVDGEYMVFAVERKTGTPNCPGGRAGSAAMHQYQRRTDAALR